MADGRRMCRRCRRKFTSKVWTGRLKAAQARELVRLFWLLVPASRAAVDLKVGRKTALRYYTLLRQAIMRQAQCQMGQLSGQVEVDESYFGGHRKGKRGRGAGGKVPVFGLLKRGGQVRVVFPERVDRRSLHGAIKTHVKPQSVVYSDKWPAYRGLHLEGFHHRRIDHKDAFAMGKAHINGIENFWGFAKRRLKLYHGGFKKNFRLFLHEMEFRFNHRHDPNPVRTLLSLLKSGPV